MHVAAGDFGMQDAAGRVDEREIAAVGERDAQIHAHQRIYRKRGIHARQQIFQAGAGDGGGENFIFVAAVGFLERGEFFG